MRLKSSRAGHCRTCDVVTAYCEGFREVRTCWLPPNLEPPRESGSEDAVPDREGTWVMLNRKDGGADLGWGSWDWGPDKIPQLLLLGAFWRLRRNKAVGVKLRSLIVLAVLLLFRYCIYMTDERADLWVFALGKISCKKRQLAGHVLLSGFSWQCVSPCKSVLLFPCRVSHGWPPSQWNVSVLLR